MEQIINFTSYGEVLVKEKIVRCKDCKYFSDIAFLSCDFFTDVYGDPHELLDDCGFCAWGVPKEVLNNV